jgi:hypothetical protein
MGFYKLLRQNIKMDITEIKKIEKQLL